MNTNQPKHQISPVAWVPTVYFAMGMPFVVLNMVTALMFKGLVSRMPRLPSGLR